MDAFELLREFNQLGCKDQIKTALAVRVYQNLLATKKYNNIDKSYNKELNIIYVLASDDGNNSRHIFLPLLSTQDLELHEIELIQTKLKELHNDCAIHLTICDAASNILFYTITSGFLDNEINVTRKR